MAKDFSVKLRKAKSAWVQEYNHSVDLIIRNGVLLENLRRTLKPLKHYYQFLVWLDMSKRSASRLVAIGKREKMGDEDIGILSKYSKVLPDSIATLEILLRLKDGKLKNHIKNKKITKLMSRKDAHILVDGKDANKEVKNTLKEKFRTTSKFTDIRITSGYDDEKKLMSLLKDLKALKKKYAFIEFDDKGYVDRTKKKLRRQEKIVATNTLSKKEQTALDKKLKQIGAKKKSSDKFSALKGIKV